MSLTDEHKESYETELYGRRWVLLIILFVLNVSTTSTYTSFGEVNDVYSAYFGVDPKEIDLLTVGTWIGAFVSTIGLAVPASSEKIGLRFSFICGAIFQTISFVCMVIASIGKNLFSLAVIGQLFNLISIT